MKILLINPPLELYPEEFLSVVPPLGLAYIGAVLEKKGHQVAIFDCLALGWHRPQIIKRGRRKIRYLYPGDIILKKIINDFQPDLVGISNMLTINEDKIFRLAKIIKQINPEIKIVLGGANASARPKMFLKNINIDFVVMGEGERTAEELVKVIAEDSVIPNSVRDPNGMPKRVRHDKLCKIDGLAFKIGKKIIINPPRSLIKDLDSLPFPAWHLLPMEEYFQGHPAGLYYKKKRFAMVLSSRGCPNRCCFCTNELLWKAQWRGRSVKNVMAEIHQLRQKYDIKEIQFMDSNMSVDKKRMRELCQALVKEKLPWLPYTGTAVLTLDVPLIKLMARSGCYALQFGVEHGDPNMQKVVGKIVPLEATEKIVAECKKWGVWTHGYFIVGLPGENQDTAYQSREFAISAGFDSASFFTALPLPGSKLYYQLYADREVDLGNLRVYLSQQKTSELSLTEIDTIIKNSLRGFMISKIKNELLPVNFIRRLKTIKDKDDFLFYWRVLKRFIELNLIKITKV